MQMTKTGAYRPEDGPEKNSMCVVRKTGWVKNKPVV